MESNWDFRTCSIYPTYDEVVGVVKAPLKANVVDGPFKSVEQYLETHFWLMREEVVGPLRQKVDQIKRNRGNVECPPYMTAQFLRSNAGHEKSKGYKLKITNVQSGSDKDTAELQSQSLMHGSLVCFTCNSFETLIFATISYRDKNFMEKSQVFVKFLSKFKEDIFRREYIMIESGTFFWSYEQVLQVIQRTEANDFPFPQYFIEVSKGDALPRYMRESSKTISIKGVDQDFASVQLLQPNSWPTAAEIGLDESQLLSLQAALTRELAFILGPPGTGKTYVGLTVAQILIENKAALNLKKPILVISSTNHSLDRFLIELLNLTDNFVRIGQQSKFPQLNPYNYNKLEGTWYERLAYQDVIGMTASKASEWRPKLTALGCEVVIIEDASVLFDAQLFACLPKNCQHLIMIGGEKQLQPKLKNPDDLVSLNLNVSFFKRMLDNRGSQKPLRFQYRMPPEMTKLISPLIYPEMKHNANVLSLPVLELLPNRVSFVTHNYPESPEEIEVRTPEQNIKHWKTGNSKKNYQEASFVVALCKYLLLQKVAPLDVTILTTYLSQSDLIKKLIKEEKSKARGLASVDVATVDNFQGGENKFIILSLVRSNSCGALGFLDEEHRIGVALSKAQNALIIIGNMGTLSSRSSNWCSIKQTLDEQDLLSSWLELRCMANPSGKHLVTLEELDKFERICSENCCRGGSHQNALQSQYFKKEAPKYSGLFSSKESENILESRAMYSPFSVKDFSALGSTFPVAASVNGQVSRTIKQTPQIATANPVPSVENKNLYVLTRKRCLVLKSCGHKCSYVCTIGEAHSSMHETREICNEPCPRMCKAGLHRCKQLCHVYCGPCLETLTVTNTCGRHRKDVLCNDRKPASGVCEAVCNRTMRCGHICTKTCHLNDCSKSCWRCIFTRVFLFGCISRRRANRR